MSFTEASMDEKIVDNTQTLEQTKVEARLEQAKGHGLGSLVATVDEARAEYGEEFASKLKLADDGVTVLIPQPSDDPEDPLNWTSRRKAVTFVILILATLIPDFSSSVGNATLFGAPQELGVTATHYNAISTSWSIFLLGPGGLIAALLCVQYGRLPVIFWSQFLGLAGLILCAAAPTFAAFSAGRMINSFFSSATQVMGLYLCKDMWPFHQQAVYFSFWAWTFVFSPYAAPFFFGFLVQRQSWRWAYGVTCIYVGIVCMLIALFMEETLYDRDLPEQPLRTQNPVKYRVETVLGITGWRMSKHRRSFWRLAAQVTNLSFKPISLMTACVYGVFFTWSIGVNVSIVVFVSGKPYNFGGDQVSLLYLTPMIGSALGEVFCHYFTPWIIRRWIRTHGGRFDPEANLLCLFFAIILLVVGLVVIGAALQYALTVGALIMGWGLYVCGVVIMTNGTFGFLGDTFRGKEGEVSAMMGMWRDLSGFATGYYMIQWVNSGPLKAFGIMAGTCGAVFLFVPLLLWKGDALRARSKLNF